MLALSGSIRTNAAASMKPAPAATKYRSGGLPLPVGGHDEHGAREIGGRRDRREGQVC